MNPTRPIVIGGPTASGKTAVAAALAAIAGGVIISADSRQVYRYLDIGTNKAGMWDEKKRARIVSGIDQYLTDCIEPSETFSAGDFVRAAEKLVEDCIGRRIFPIITGGTGLYIRALTEGLAPLPEKDEPLRRQLAKLIEEKGLAALYEQLKAVDPSAAQKNIDNPQRLVRALEVYRLTGIPLTELQKKKRPPRWKYSVFTLRRPRHELYETINERSTAMLSSGMIEETKAVLNKGFAPDCPGLGGIGYRDIVRYINNEESLETVKRSLARDTRHYAKRQITWFKRQIGTAWIDADKAGFDPVKIAENIMKSTS